MKRSIFITFFLISLISGCGRSVEYTFDEDAESVESLAPIDENKADDASDDEKIQTIYIDICGRVAFPGVYELPSEARLFEAIEAAGGMCEDAAYESINQAQMLADGQKIYIMSLEEWEAQKQSAGVSDAGMVAGAVTADGALDGLVNINTATESELCNLPGIGATRAQAIIAYREAHGGFASVEDIQNVSGIKSGTYEKIYQLIKVQ